MTIQTWIYASVYKRMFNFFFLKMIIIIIILMAQMMN